MTSPEHVRPGALTRRTRHRIDTNGDRLADDVDEIAVEEPLEIRIAGDSVAMTMRTPGEDAALVAGFLYAEGIIRSRADLGTVSHCGRPGEDGYGNVLDVIPAGGARLPIERFEATRRGTLTTSACGVCGRRTVDDLLARCPEVDPQVRISSRLIASAPDVLRAHQETFARTGGVHAAAALDGGGQRLAFAEDVGRHNAVDKVVGRLLLDGVLESRAARVLVVSGRTSFELVQKAAMAGIPCVASVSAPSSLAIDLAERSGILLACFVREGRWTCYSHPEKLER